MANIDAKTVPLPVNWIIERQHADGSWEIIATLPGYTETQAIERARNDLSQAAEHELRVVAWRAATQAQRSAALALGMAEEAQRARERSTNFPDLLIRRPHPEVLTTPVLIRLYQWLRMIVHLLRWPLLLLPYASAAWLVIVRPPFLPVSLFGLTTGLYAGWRVSRHREYPGVVAVTLPLVWLTMAVEDVFEAPHITRFMGPAWFFSVSQAVMLRWPRKSGK